MTGSLSLAIGLVLLALVVAVVIWAVAALRLGAAPPQAPAAPKS